MDDLTAHLGKVSKIAIFFLLACFVGWTLLPEYRGYLAGLLLGGAVSLINAHYLSFKIKQMSQNLVDKQNRRINLGFLTRASLAVLAIMLASKSVHIEIVTTIIGLFLMQAATLLLGILFVAKKE
jgi:ATP synthase protein I